MQPILAGHMRDRAKKLAKQIEERNVDALTVEAMRTLAQRKIDTRAYSECLF